MRRTLVLVAIAFLAISLPACGKKETRLDEVLAAVRRTQRQPHRFIYTDRRPENAAAQEPAQDFRVLGLVEDDFRFKARAEVDGNPAFDEVVTDDLLGIRFLDPSQLGQLLDRNKAQTANLDTDIPGVNVIDALRAKRWVFDLEGAPPVTANVRPEKELGADPILDSLTALDYVAQAAKQAAGVKKFTTEDLEPAYPNTEDVFAKPGKGEERFDLVRPRLPSIATSGGAPVAGGQSAFPGTKHFRKMAIYVRKGIIVRVRESIEVKGKYLNSVLKYVRKSVEQSKSQDAIDAYQDFLKETPRSKQGLAVLQFLSFGLQSFGQDPILVRNMSINNVDFGGVVKVALPTDGIVKGSLGLLRASAGSEAGQPQQTPGSDAGGATTDGSTPDGSTTDGSTTDGSTTDGSTTGGSPGTTTVVGSSTGSSGSGSTGATTP